MTIVVLTKPLLQITELAALDCAIIPFRSLQICSSRQKLSCSSTAHDAVAMHAVSLHLLRRSRHCLHCPCAINLQSYVPAPSQLRDCANVRCSAC